MIHKFDDIPAKINTHSNIFVLVDEAHRFNGSYLGNYLMGALSLQLSPPFRQSHNVIKD